MGTCESPMSCAETGDVDPVTGAWVYQLPADIAPTVPFGPRFEFRRTYMSKYAPPATNYRTAMGNRWQHNFQSWLDKSGTSVVIHLPTGQEIKASYSSSPGDGFDYYNNFQAGAHFKHLRQAIGSPNHWELRTLTGEVYKFNWTSPVGKLIEIHDSLATPNKIVITYFTSGGNNGQLDTVLDASGKKRFKFSYSQNRVSSVAYQTGSGGSWTTRATLSLSYSSADPTTVSLGGSTIQTNTYSSSYLTNIADGAGKTLVNVNYVAATPGKIANVTTGGGSLGYDFGSSHTQCTGKTALYFNLANATSCNVDSDCGTGLRCGGKTGAGTTGKCYRAARCLGTSSPSENLVTTVTPFTPCTGACAPTAEYLWSSSTLHLKGIKLADGNWTSYDRDHNGMVTVMAEGDFDSDPYNAGGAAKKWFFYSNASFPGRVTEVRRVTDTSRAPVNCSASTTTDCKRTFYTWNSDGLLGSKQEVGFTGTSGATSFSYTTGYTYDSKGRLTQIDGPLSGSNDVTDFTYWTSADVLKDGYPNLVKRKKNSTEFLTTTLDVYDSFGNATSTQDPDGTFTCRTWDGARNYVTQVREAMNGQTSCVTSHSSDLVTSYLRDTALRLTRTTNPLGDCEHREYDSWGRHTHTKPRDDCNAGNAGFTKVQSYTAGGQNDVTEWLDASATVKKKSKTLYTDGLQVGSIENPVSPSYSRTFSYFADGAQQLLTFENGIGITEWVRDTQNRPTSHKRFTGPSGANLAWSLFYPASGLTSTRTHERVVDPASKAVYTYVDDLQRRTSMLSPDSGTTTYVYDAASRRTTQVEASGTTDALTRTYTFDNIGRTLTESSGTTCSGSVTDVQSTYDALPGGVGCPSGASCTRLGGRLAHVKTFLLCSGIVGGPVSPIYQETFYGYDDSGRLISEYIGDSTGRTAQQNYSWDKNGNLLDVKAPSGASMTTTFGSTGNSDANLASTIARTVGGTPTNLLTSILWMPFGPVAQYDQPNTISGTNFRATLTWNAAYRATQVKYATTGGVQKTTIDYTEDEKGRYVQKLYSNVHSGVLHDYLKFDWLDRATCDAPTSGTCPTSSSNAYTNITAYNSSNDRESFRHSAPGFGDHAYTYKYFSGTDQIDYITSGTAGTTVYEWNGRGDRLSDDNTNSTVDRRDYTYDSRRRVKTVTGKFVHGPFFRDYRVTYAYDERDRLVFRSLVTLSSGDESHTFYYYDVNDRLIEIKVVPNITDTSTYTIYNFYWLGSRPVAMWATSFPNATTARYFVHADEADRVLEVYTWPTSGDSTLVWAINPDVFGWDNIATSLIFQPLRLSSNALADDVTQSWKDNIPTLNRPMLLVARDGHFDPMTATAFQRMGEWPSEGYRGYSGPANSESHSSSLLSGCRGRDIVPPATGIMARFINPNPLGGRISGLMVNVCIVNDATTCYDCYRTCDEYMSAIVQCRVHFLRVVNGECAALEQQYEQCKSRCANMEACQCKSPF
jgi:hypothetical protein